MHFKLRAQLFHIYSNKMLSIKFHAWGIVIPISFCIFIPQQYFPNSPLATTVHLPYADTRQNTKKELENAEKRDLH